MCRGCAAHTAILCKESGNVLCNYKEKCTTRKMVHKKCCIEMHKTLQPYKKSYEKPYKKWTFKLKHVWQPVFSLSCAHFYFVRFLFCEICHFSIYFFLFCSFFFFFSFFSWHLLESSLPCWRHLQTVTPFLLTVVYVYIADMFTTCQTKCLVGEE